MMTKDVQIALKAMQKNINDAIYRLDQLNGLQHTDNSEQISDLQDYILEDSYEKTLEELGV